MGGRGGSSGLINSTGRKKLEKGIRTKKRRINEHISYIRNPKLKYADWDSFSDARKEREWCFICMPYSLDHCTYHCFDCHHICRM